MSKDACVSIDSITNIHMYKEVAQYLGEQRDPVSACVRWVSHCKV